MKPRGKSCWAFLLIGKTSPGSRKEELGEKQGKRKSKCVDMLAISKCNRSLNLQDHSPKKSWDHPSEAGKGEILSSGSYLPALKGSALGC